MNKHVYSLETLTVKFEITVQLIISLNQLADLTQFGSGSFFTHFSRRIKKNSHLDSHSQPVLVSKKLMEDLVNCDITVKLRKLQKTILVVSF